MKTFYRWRKGDWVRLIKRAQKVDALVESGSWATYCVGTENNCSLPVDYELEGFLLAAPKAGLPLRVDRRIRNGVQVNGIFSSSPVVEICESRIVTLNSNYEMEKVNIPQGMERQTMIALDAEGLE